MTFRDYVAIAWRRKFVIVIPVILAAVAVLFLYTRSSASATYTASATVRVPSVPLGSRDYLSYNLSFDTRLMNTYTVIATSEPLRRNLADALGMSLGDLPQIRVDAIEETELIRISMTDRDAGLTAEAANTLAELFVAEVEDPLSQSSAAILREEIDVRAEELNTARGDYRDLVAEYGPEDDRVITAARNVNVLETNYINLLQQYESVRVNEQLRIVPAVIVEPASVPSNANTPNLILNLGLAVALAGSLGVTLMLLMENLDTRLFSVRDVRGVTDTPVIDVLPVGRRGKLVDESQPRRLTKFRDLRTSLFMMMPEGTLESLVVTSGDVGAATTELVANLGVATARGGRKALLIDGNMRTPRLHKLFNMENTLGLSDLCGGVGSHALADAVRQTNVNGLHVLTAGPIPEDPPELLASSCMRDLLDAALAEYDMVLFDAPPVSATTDAQVLSRLTQATVLLVRTGQTTSDELLTAEEHLRLVNGNLLGIVVNN